MSEMALTADHLIVVGRGRLIADMSTETFLQQASGNIVHVRSPSAARLQELLVGPDVVVDAVAGGLIEVRGLTAAQIGDIAAAHQIPLHELTPQQASLEEAFMEITRDDVEFKTVEPLPVRSVA
jgi:ABC-2 type transport system ATP-binding protein